MISLATLKERLPTNPEVKAEYDRLGPVHASIGAMHEPARRLADRGGGGARDSRKAVSNCFSAFFQSSW